jgi:hypothetical protein
MVGNLGCSPFTPLLQKPARLLTDTGRRIRLSDLPEHQTCTVEVELGQGTERCTSDTDRAGVNSLNQSWEGSRVADVTESEDGRDMDVDLVRSLVQYGD